MRSIYTRGLAAVIVVAAQLVASEASAQGFLSPYIGSTFSGPALACASITGCEEGKTTFGVGLGTLGNVFGFELDLGYTKGFLGETEDEATSSGLLTVMGNVMIGPKIGPVQPFVLGGLGMLKLNVDLDVSSILEDSETKLAWDLGGGVIIFFGDHVGIRGDLRHFRTIQDFDFLPLLSVDSESLSFNRASAALVLKF